MAVDSNMQIDPQNKEATLNIIIQSQATETFFYALDSVTAEERASPITVNLNDFQVNLNFTDVWISQVQNLLRPASSAISEFEQEIKKTSSKLEAKLTHGTDVLVLSEFDPSTNELTFDARDNITLNFSDFVNWINFLRNYSGFCINF